MKNKLILYIVVIFAPYFSKAQVNQGGSPITFSQDYLNLFLSSQNGSGTPTYSISTYNLPALNNITEKRIADSLSPTSANVGTMVSVDIDLRTAASVQYLEDSSKIYLLKIASATANGLSFYFDHFNLPTGSRLFFYNSDTSMVIGSFTELNNTEYNVFHTQPLNGDTVLIEYFEPYNPVTTAQLHINKIAHLFVSPFGIKVSSSQDRTSASEANCEIDVICPDGVGWEAPASSVALIFYYDSGNGKLHVGSGAVINNTSHDGHPYLLTAYHLLADLSNYTGYYPTFIKNELLGWTFVFNYYNKTCGGNDPTSVSYQNASQSVTAASLVTGDINVGTTDYMLLDLTIGLVGNTTNIQGAADVLVGWDVCYSGWDRTVNGQGTASAPFVCIHHPNGSGNATVAPKKISTTTQTLGIMSLYLANPGTGLTVTWDTDANGDPTHGITEQGSSGSPLYNTAQRIIGQLYSGNHDCSGTIQGSNYGNFQITWDNDLLFSGALDPINSGVQNVDTYCYTVGAGGTIGPSNGSIPNNGIGTGTSTGNGTANTTGTPIIGTPDQVFDMNDKFSQNITLCPNERPVIHVLQNAFTNNDISTYIPAKEFVVPCSAPHDENILNWDFTHTCYSTKQFYYLSVYTGCDQYFNNCVEHGNWHYYDVVANGGNWMTDIDVQAQSGITMTPGNYYRVKLAINRNYPDITGWWEGNKFVNMAAYDLTLNNQTLQGDYVAASHITMTSDNIGVASNVHADAGVQVDIQQGTHISPGADFHAWISGSSLMPCYDGHRFANTSDTTNKSSSNQNQNTQNTNVVTIVKSPKNDGFIPPGISKQTKTASGFVYKYSIWPNPSNAKVNIAFNTNDNDNVTINIYTSLGVKIASLVENKVYFKGQNNIEYDVSFVQDGMYLIEIKNNEETNLLKLNVIK